MNVTRPRYPVHTFGSAADLPWDQILQAGTQVATTAIQESGKSRHKKHKKKVEEPETETAPQTTTVAATSTPIPWGPILLVVGTLTGALIYSRGKHR